MVVGVVVVVTVVVVTGGVQFCGRVIVVLGPFDGATPSPQMPSACGVSVSELTVVGILYEPENDQLFAWLNAPVATGCAMPEVSLTVTSALLRVLFWTSAVTVNVTVPSQARLATTTG